MITSVSIAAARPETGRPRFFARVGAWIDLLLGSIGDGLTAYRSFNHLVVANNAKGAARLGSVELCRRAFDQA